MNCFQASCQTLLMGSLPVMDDRKALDLVMECTPSIPGWVQMPGRGFHEGMVAQFSPGLPCLKEKEKSLHVDTSDPAFQSEMLRFYEAYLDIQAAEACLNESRFVLSQEAARGFYAFLDRLIQKPRTFLAVKGQVTGPFTLGTAIKDQFGMALFHNDELRDMVVKLVSLKAKWQTDKLSTFDLPVILFIDEPALAGFGSSEFLSVSRETVLQALSEVVDSIHEVGGMAGVHVCANTDWSILFEVGMDIINFDAYAYFDRFILYARAIVDFLSAGKWLAWGIVPTLDKEAIEKETSASLTEKLKKQMEQMAGLGIAPSVISSQSLITPSCGAGSLDLELTKKVLRMTKDVAENIRNGFKTSPWA